MSAWDLRKINVNREKNLLMEVLHVPPGVVTCTSDEGMQMRRSYDMWKWKVQSQRKIFPAWTRVEFIKIGFKNSFQYSFSLHDCHKLIPSVHLPKNICLGILCSVENEMISRRYSQPKFGGRTFYWRVPRLGFPRVRYLTDVL